MTEPNTPVTTPRPPSQHTALDVLAVCWGILAITLALGPLIGVWAGKSEFIVTELAIGAFAWGYLRWRRYRPKRTFRLNGVSGGLISPFLFIAAGSGVVLDEIDRLIQIVIPLSDEHLRALTDAVAIGSVVDAFWVIVGVGVVTPIVEESIFRGFVQQSLENRKGVTKGVLSTSLIFALIHLQPWWIIQILLMAMLSGYLAWRWHSVVPAVLIHSANNILFTLILNGGDSRWLDFYLSHGHVNPIILLGAIIAIWWGFRIAA